VSAFDPAQSRQQPLDAVLVGDTAQDLLLFGLPPDLPPERELLVERMEFVLGGSAAITAHNLAALGARVGFVTPQAEDLFGIACRAQLAQASVDLSRTVPTACPTGVTVMVQHQGFRRAFTYPGNATRLELRDLDLEYLCSARHFHLSSLFLQRALRDDVPRLFATLKSAGLTISLDTNDDPWDEWPASLAACLGYVDILMPNEREACRITGLADPEAAIGRLRREIPTLVVKRGSAGAAVFRGDFEESQRAVPAPFLDAVGAGDSFNAGFLYGFLNGESLSDCLRLGNIAGAYSTTGAGGTTAFRDRARLQQFLGEHRAPSAQPSGQAGPTA
jgi:sugar/nucleoside kinase (ribokinase family)